MLSVTYRAQPRAGAIGTHRSLIEFGSVYEQEQPSLLAKESCRVAVQDTQCYQGVPGQTRTR